MSRYSSAVVADGPTLYWRLGDASASAYQAAVLADDPLAYWPLSESAAPFGDASGHGHPLSNVIGTIDAGAAAPFAGSGTSCSFGGAGSLQSASAPSGVAPGDDWTIEAWIRPTMPDLTWGSWLFYGTADESGYIAADIRYDPDVTNQIEAYTTTSPGTIITTELRDAWHHLCFVATAGSIAGYVDGTLVTPYVAFASSDTAPASPIFSVGDIPGWGEQWRGQLAHVAFYGAALDGARISAHYDAAGGLTVADASGNGETGTASGDVATGADGLLLRDPDGAALFGPTGGAIDQDATSTRPESVSIELWLQTTQATGAILATFESLDATQRDLTLYLRPDGTPAFACGATEVVAPLALYNGRRYHVVADLSDEQASIRVNGIVRAGPDAASVGTSFTGRWRLGGGSSSTAGLVAPPLDPLFRGVLDELAIYTP